MTKSIDIIAMMSSLKSPEQILEESKNILVKADFSALQKEIDNLEMQTAQADFWQQAGAGQVMKKLSELKQQLEQYQNLKDTIEELETALFLATDDGQTDYQEQIYTISEKLSQQNHELSLKEYLSGTYDKLGAIFSIHSGQGGVEAMDFAAMLQRMYQRYFERKNWKYRLVDESRGEEAGIKSASYEGEAPYA
jgi:peptide chain release factor 2